MLPPVNSLPEEEEELRLSAEFQVMMSLRAAFQVMTSACMHGATAGGFGAPRA